MPKGKVDKKTIVDITVDESAVQECVEVKTYPAGTPMAEIVVGVGGTIPTAPFANVKVYVEVRRPVPDSDVMIEEAYQETKENVQVLMADLVDEISPLWGGK